MYKLDLQGPVDTCEVKIADFGLSALVRIDEDGYDAEESGKRKRYNHLKEVGLVIVYYAYACYNHHTQPQL